MTKLIALAHRPLLLLGCCLVLALPPAHADGQAARELVVVVSPEAGISRLPRQHLADLYLGRTGQFPDGNRATPVDLSEGSDLRELFTARILERTSAQVRAHWAKIIFTGRGRPPVAVADGEAVKQLIARNPQTIGYIDRRLVDDQVVVVAVE